MELRYPGGSQTFTTTDELLPFHFAEVATNASYCVTACSTAQSVQLDHFLTSPSGAFDAGEWSAATITGMGTIGIGSFVLDHSYARGLGMREYEETRGSIQVVIQMKYPILFAFVLSTLLSGCGNDGRPNLYFDGKNDRFEIQEMDQRADIQQQKE